MSAITLIELGDGTPPLSALPDIVKLPESLSANLDVLAIRLRLRDEADQTNGFIIAFGDGCGNSIVGMSWRDGEALMRRAFGVLTGAARALQDRSGGPIVVLLPSFAVVQIRQPTAAAIWLRAILGMTEALRAELGNAPTRVSIVFYAADTPDEGLPARLRDALDHTPMYSLSPDLTAERIRTYFDTMLAAVDRATAGPPLPDIGPMAVVYDPASIGVPDRR